MPREILCAHCGKYVTRKQEQEHRKLVITLHVEHTPNIPSSSYLVIDTDSESDEHESQDHFANEPSIGSAAGSPGSPFHGEAMQIDNDLDDDILDADEGDLQGEQDFLDFEDILHAAQNSHCMRWRVPDIPSDSDSNSGSEDEVTDAGDDSDDGYVDWDAIESNYGLSAWDRLGESYDRDVAAIGMLIGLLFIYPLINSIQLTA